MFKSLKSALRRKRYHRHGIEIAVELPISYFGTEDEGWGVADWGLNANSIVYSFGIGLDASFDTEMIERYGMKVYGFDPTPRSVQWVAEQDFPEQFQFLPVGIAHVDGEWPFFPPKKAKSAHFTPIKRYVDLSAEPVYAPVKQLQTIMQELGHKHIDVFKIDIEGGEYDVMDNILKTGVRPDQLLLEFHHNYPTIHVSQTIKMLHRLQEAGYTVYHISESTYCISLIRAECIAQRPAKAA